MFECSDGAVATFTSLEMLLAGDLSTGVPL